jgi:predicted ATP-grasp superfamily ATP-dependent carboligase
MRPDDRLLILGASTRAAAFSALRAGMQPWCADLFADCDLRQRCSVVLVPPGQYPEGFLDLAFQEISGPWMYTGALENRPALIEKISERRTLWGNGQLALSLARSPYVVATLVKKAGLPCPAVVPQLDASQQSCRWLVKPLKSAGGAGIAFASDGIGSKQPSDRVYFQEFIEGQPCSAVYVGDGVTARLLGITQQLVGESWLHAAPFHYCGSIGPMELSYTLRSALEELGTVLTGGCGLRGLFGVDGIMQEGSFWPVEINPRYTASVEVIEYATGVSALALHANAFDTLPVHPGRLKELPTSMVGKAILFAKAPLVFPQEGPWLDTPASLSSIDEPPAFADIPQQGESIEKGRPVLTLLTKGFSAESCASSLQHAVAVLDAMLYRPC